MDAAWILGNALSEAKQPLLAIKVYELIRDDDVNAPAAKEKIKQEYEKLPIENVGRDSETPNTSKKTLLPLLKGIIAQPTQNPDPSLNSIQKPIEPPKFTQ